MPRATHSSGRLKRSALPPPDLRFMIRTGSRAPDPGLLDAGAPVVLVVTSGRFASCLAGRPGRRGAALSAERIAFGVRRSACRAEITEIRPSPATATTIHTLITASTRPATIAPSAITATSMARTLISPRRATRYQQAVTHPSRPARASVNAPIRSAMFSASSNSAAASETSATTAVTRSETDARGAASAARLSCALVLANC